MTIGTKYGGRPAPVASYDWLDLTSGLGYRTYYGAAWQSNAGIKYFLTSRAVYSSSGTAKSDTATLTKYTAGADADIDFDILFNIPAIVGAGDAYVNVMMDSVASDMLFTINVYHVNAAAAETSLGTATTNTINWGGGQTYRKYLIPVTLTEKKFAIGDKIRLNIIMTNTDASDVYIYHDPASGITQTDELGRTIGTDLTFDVPFKVIL